MKSLLKITLIGLLVTLFSTLDASAQEARKKKEKSVKTEQPSKSLFQSNDQTSPSTNHVSKKAKKATIWDVVPAEDFVATGDPDVDKKLKMNAQRRWIKLHPKEFVALIEEHGIKSKDK